MPDKLDTLYSTLSEQFELGSPEEFRRKIADPSRRRALFDAASSEYDLADFPTFSAKVDSVLAAAPTNGNGHKTVAQEMQGAIAERTPTISEVQAPVVQPPQTLGEVFDAAGAFYRRGLGEIQRLAQSLIFEPPTATERTAQAQNTVALAKELGIRPAEAEARYAQLRKRPDIVAALGESNLFDEIPVLPVAASLIAGHPGGVVGVVKGMAALAGFAAAEPLVRAVVGAPPDQRTRPMVALIEGIAGAGAASKGVAAVPKLATMFTKRLIRTYRLPQTIEFSPSQMRTAQGIPNEAPLTPMELVILKDAKLPSSQWRRALKDGVAIRVPASQLTQLVDRSWWATFKQGVIGQAPVSPVGTLKTLRGERPTVARGELPPAAPRTFTRTPGAVEASPAIAEAEALRARAADTRAAQAAPKQLPPAEARPLPTAVEAAETRAAEVVPAEAPPAVQAEPAAPVTETGPPPAETSYALNMETGLIHEFGTIQARNAFLQANPADALPMQQGDAVREMRRGVKVIKEGTTEAAAADIPLTAGQIVEGRFYAHAVKEKRVVEFESAEARDAFVKRMPENRKSVVPKSAVRVVKGGVPLTRATATDLGAPVSRPVAPKMDTPQSRKQAVDAAIKAADTPPPPRPVISELLPSGRVLLGNADRVFLPDATEVPVTWAVVDAADVRTSHDINLRMNEDYPARKQPRDRERVASDVQVHEIVQNLQPGMLAESPSAGEGAPVVDVELDVLSGNARMIALARIEKNFPEQRQAYRAMVEAKAAELGMDPAKVRAMAAPRLVRVLSPGADVARFVDQANRPTVAAMSPAEQAMADAKVLTPAMVLSVEMNQAGIVHGPGVADMADALFAGAARGGFMDRTGQLSQPGQIRLRNALVSKAYTDMDLLELMAESTDPDQANLVMALRAAAGPMARFQAATDAGMRDPYTIGRDLMDGMQRVKALKDTGTPIETFLAQGELLKEFADPLHKAIVGTFAKNARSAQKIAAVLIEYVKAAEATADPAQASLLSDAAKPSKLDLWEAAVRKVEAAEGQQGSLLEAPKPSKRGLSEPERRLLNELSRPDFGVDPTLLGTAINVAAGQILQGAKNFSQMVGRMRARMGPVWNKLRPWFQHIWQAAWRKAQSILPGIHVKRSTLAQDRAAVESATRGTNLRAADKNRMVATLNARPVRKPVYQRAWRGFLETWKATEYFRTPVSSRLLYRAPELFRVMRKLDFEIENKTKHRTVAILPFQKAVEKARMDPADHELLDNALRDGEGGVIENLVEKYGLQKEYQAARGVLNEIHADAREVGYAPGYLANHWPRMIIDMPGFVEATEGRSRLKTVVEGPPLPGSVGPEEGIFTGTPGPFLRRRITKVGPDLRPYYASSYSALIPYIRRVTRQIEIRRLFRPPEEQGGAQQDLPFGDLEGTEPVYQGPALGQRISDEEIGTRLDRLLPRRLSPDERRVAVAAFRAYANYQPMRGPLAALRDIGYITTLGKGIAATIRQIGDQYMAAWVAPREWPGALVDAIRGKSEITKDMMMFDRVAAEFEDYAKLAKWADLNLRYNGFVKIDAIGKETLVNAANRRIQKEIAAGKLSPKVRSILQRVYGPEHGPQKRALVAEATSGTVGPETLYVAWNLINDFQPVSLTEMPQFALDHPNARILYSLKFFQLRRLDVMRREAFHSLMQEREGGGQRSTTDRKTALRNLAGLTAIMILADAGPDVINDLLSGRPINLTDTVAANLYRMILMNRYVVQQFGRGAPVDQVIADLTLPPSSWMDDLSLLARKWDDVAVKPWTAEILRNFPIIGQGFYDWFGGGVVKRERRGLQVLSKKSREGLLSPEEVQQLLREERSIRTLKPLTPKGDRARDAQIRRRYQRQQAAPVIPVP